MQSIILHDLPKVSTNSIYAGQHWMARKKLKGDFLWLTSEPMKKLKPVIGKVDLEFIFHFKSRPLDSSNCGFSGKMLEDCLVQHGILKGDSIQFVGKVSYESRKSDKEFCEIIIH